MCVRDAKVVFDDCRAFADKRCLLNRGLDLVEQSFQPYLFVVLARPDTVFDSLYTYFMQLIGAPALQPLLWLMTVTAEFDPILISKRIRCLDSTSLSFLLLLELIVGVQSQSRAFPSY